LKLILTCKKCLKSGFNKPQWTYVEPINEEVYEVICDKLHKTKVILAEQKFEILFDSAAMALVDGYYHDAVITFSLSLEKFYLFFIELILSHNQIKYSEYQNIWKQVENNSERLLGAFNFLYLLEFKKEPPQVAPEYREFKENVINNRYRPKYDELLDFGEYLFKYMMDFLDFISLQYSESLKQFIINRMIRLTEKSKKIKKKITPLPVATIIHPPTDDKAFNYKSFRQALEEFKKYKTWMYEGEEKR